MHPRSKGWWISGLLALSVPDDNGFLFVPIQKKKREGEREKGLLLSSTSISGYSVLHVCCTRLRCHDVCCRTTSISTHLVLGGAWSIFVLFNTRCLDSAGVRAAALCVFASPCGDSKSVFYLPHIWERERKRRRETSCRKRQPTLFHKDPFVALFYCFWSILRHLQFGSSVK